MSPTQGATDSNAEKQKQKHDPSKPDLNSGGQIWQPIGKAVVGHFPVKSPNDQKDQNSKKQ